MTTLTQNFPQINAPFVNSDGIITAPWRQFLQALFLRTGGAVSPGVGAFNVTEDDTSNHDYFPSWVTVNTGTATANVSSTKLKWNPSTGLLTAPSFSGSVYGNAQTTTALQNPRVLSIGGTTGLYAVGVAFDGTVNVNFTLAGNLNLANGGTSSNLSVTGGTSQVLKQSSLGAAITVGQLAASDLSNGQSGSGAVALVNSPVLINPALGTVGSGDLSNCTGTAYSLTAGHVVTNANLYGDVTSVGNNSSVVRIGGVGVGTPTGTTNIVLSNSPTLVTPNLGAASATSINFGQTSLNFYQEGYWTPTDASGASLTFASASGKYTRIGRMVFAEFYIVYPTTANTNHAIIGGLPFTVGSGVGGGFAPAYFSIQNSWQCNAGATTASAYNVTGGGITNVNLTGATLSGVLSYNV